MREPSRSSSALATLVMNHLHGGCDAIADPTIRHNGARDFSKYPSHQAFVSYLTDALRERFSRDSTIRFGTITAEHLIEKAFGFLLREKAIYDPLKWEKSGEWASTEEYVGSLKNSLRGELRERGYR